MSKMPQDSKAFASDTAPVYPANVRQDTHSTRAHKENGLIIWLKGLLPPQLKNDELLREAIEDYIEEPQSAEGNEVSRQEKELFSNVLELRDINVCDVMLPRTDIIAIDIDTTNEELLAILSEHTYSRFPVYKETLDDVQGSLHIKDIVTTLAKGQTINLKDILTDLPIVAPSMPILDLLLLMRKTRRHMVLVIDEYGGIDGMVTIGDILETIIGQIDDEHEADNPNKILENADGSFLANARVTIEDFEERFGDLLTPEEREESDTLGGLVFAMAGRVPVRGEILSHSSGMLFEVLEADPRRICKLKIRNIPERS